MQYRRHLHLEILEIRRSAHLKTKMLRMVKHPPPRQLGKYKLLSTNESRRVKTSSYQSQVDFLDVFLVCPPLQTVGSLPHPSKFTIGQFLGLPILPSLLPGNSGQPPWRTSLSLWEAGLHLRFQSYRNQQSRWPLVWASVGSESVRSTLS